MNIKEKWNKLEIRRQIKTASFERTMLSNTLVSSVMTQLPENLFKDPYIFEFLDLSDGHSEKDLEKAITLNLQKFILEIGKGFTYMGEQFRTDLLFYHRDLQCLVMFELKIQEFEPEFLGKLNFYLEALDRDVKRPHENPSIGILLCKGKEIEVVEYAMARNISPAIIADYETKLIPKNVLTNKLHQLVEQFSKEDFE
jgi:predicted nuclease of restriction endonuclease-like (RecB) superfamily